MNRIIGFGALLAVLVTLAALVSGPASAVSKSGPPSVNPYSPAAQHPYRHGVVPTVSRAAVMRAWALSHATSANNLSYGGAIDAIGVTTGAPKVYLVFYGSQWGTQGTDAHGNVTLSGDPSGEAPYLQQLLKGLGTGGETWSGVMTQYCQGVTVGAQTCPSGSAQVGYPTGGALAGVWVDESTASPSQTNGKQLGVEAVHAAGHFGNTTATANRSAQYVVLSPTGTNPDDWVNQAFCAWHDYNGDSFLTGGPAPSPYGDIAFTNLPYITDAGASCGQNFVNSGGTLDGVSIVEGHEYAETITDQNPAGGWTDASGAENGDKCAWDQGPGAPAADLALPTGSFAMQSTWANDGASGAGTCDFSHAIVGGGGGGTPPPTISCASPDGAWHNATVSLACTAADNSGKGLVNPADANFTLSTSVPAGSETANASTGSHQVCDKAGGCSTAGPIGGNKVDLKPPSVTISSPAGTGTASNPAVLASSITVSFSATDGGSGVASWTLQRSTTALSGSGCPGSWSVDNTASGSSGGSLTHSETLQIGNCYYWTLVSTDAIGNVSSTVASEVVRPSQQSPRPTITGFSPTSGSHGIHVTITGTNFTGTTSVMLRNSFASFTVVSATSIRATVPHISRGWANWTVTTPAGSTTSRNAFFVTR
jgi:IPT/TIG domain